MKDTQSIKSKKKIQIIVNGRKPVGWEYWIYSIGRILSLIVFAMVVFALSERINRLIAVWTSNWVINSTDIYSLLNNNPMVNLIFFVWLLLGIALYVKKNWKNKYFSLVGIGISVVSCILVLRQDVWYYASTPIKILSYDWLVAIVAGGFIVWSLLRCITFVCDSSRKRSNPVLTTDELEGVEISPARSAYAQMLVNELLTSNLRNETYAIAITGSWGSGKTLFLNKVKSLCKEKAILIDFNPWNSQASDHLVKDFFNLLSSELSPYFGGIKKTMDKYVSLLYSLRIHVAGNFIFQHFPGNNENNLETKKQEIANALRIIQKPIIVSIDDLDRLAGKEIFEVLRIIRNTAKFNNIIYIVTYDKDHVVSQLSLPELSIEKDYLEKIFQIELSMPKMDEKALEEDFKRLCRRGVKRIKQINAALEALTEEDYHQILTVLWSYRKVKRFVRQFSFNTNYMIESFVDGKDLPLMDILFLNIIQTIDYLLYQKMWLNPEDLFDVKFHPFSKRQYYELKGNVETDASSNYFMKRLFGKVPVNNSNGIQMVDSYYKYFYLAQPGKELSLVEFREMMALPPSENATEGMKSTIRGWVLSKDAKTATSIYACFTKSKPIIHVDSQEARTFLTALFYWLEFEDRTNANLVEVLPYLLKTGLYRINPNQQIDVYVKTLVNKWLYKGHYEKCAKILSRLLVVIDGGTKLLMDKSGVEKAIATNVDLFLKSQEWDAVLLFKDDDNAMLRMAKAYCVIIPSTGKRTSLVIDQFIAFFSQEQYKSQNLRLVEKFKGDFKSYAVYGKAANLSINWDHLISIFGDDLSKAIDYIDNCFRPSDKPSVIES
jgi:hypothetical protein